ncbi:MAG TPA: M20 family metallo-hydrolase [Chthoniobacterales bacterium]|jgi:hydantoinase/carbamoylase family amidase
MSDPRIDAWLDELATITDEPPGLTRTFLSPALERAKDVLAGWMTAAGLTVHEDEAGNLIGRYDCGDPAAGTLVCGSHLDSVRNAGRFDGPMGVVVGLLAVERAVAAGPRVHLEVAAFSDEEGVRFQTTYLGSRAYTGRLGAMERGCADRNGITVAEAMAAHVPRFPAPPPRRLLGYVEAHIEQGPVLEAENLALGVVTAIAGQTRARVTLTGRAGHAGTTPMTLRRDALAGAAECVLLIEEMGRAAGGLVATVGQLEIPAAASNVIPGEVWFTIDIRDADDATRQRFSRELFAEIETRMARRDLAVRIEIPLEAPAARCSPRLCEALAKIVERHQPRCPRLVSGAGHDAVALAEVTEAAMLFVRCRGGLSHHPDEFAATADIALAVDVLSEFLRNFSA